MPAKSKKQRRAMAIAEHEPEKLFKRNRGLKKMSKSQLHDYATTKEKGLPKKKRSQTAQDRAELRREKKQRNKRMGAG